MKFQLLSRKFAFVFIVLTFSNLGFSQLLPSIGVDTLPNDSDPICSYPIPVAPDMTFDSYPFFNGDLIPNFTLYDLNGDSLNMQSLLSNGKPVVIVALNYTCPYVRNKVPIYNDILATYGSQVEIIGIYQLEAHPDNDYSPNSGTYGNVSANVNAGIVIDQHATYLDRKLAAQQLITNEGLNIPVYMDGPCNEWWDAFGPGPATGYIIKPDGTVFVKHGWFDKIANGHDIYCDLDSLFGIQCNGTVPDGQFTLNLTTNDTVYGQPGTTIDCEADLINNSGGAVLIEIVRDQNNMDIGWTSAICADICLNETADTYSFLLADSTTQHFYMHFYSDALTEGESNTKMVFRNANDFSNQYIQDFYAVSSFAASVDDLYQEGPSFSVAPNPFLEFVSIKIDNNQKINSIRLVSISGNVVREIPNVNASSFQLEAIGVPSGIYFIELELNNGTTGRQKVIIVD